MTTVNSLIDILSARASKETHRLAYRFLVDGDSDEIMMSYGELDRSATAIAARLQSELKMGDRVLLLYPPGLEFVKAYFACLYAGVIAVPAYPPHPARPDRTLPMIQSIVKDAVPAAALITESLSSSIRNSPADLWGALELKLIETDTIPPGPEAYQPRLVHQDEIAFLQYTSGSTGNPKGVMVSHSNLLHNLEFIRNNFGLSQDSNVVFWLPPYHDMGLIGGILESVYTGYPLTLMPHLAFLQRPYRWLQAISKLRAKASGGPNFAYDLCVRKIKPEQRDTLDLSSWNLAFNGAEPIHYETMERFARYFAPCGFDKKAFLPCYGMAEATLMITGGPHVKQFQHINLQSAGLEQNRVEVSESLTDRSQQFVGCGAGNNDQKIVIVDLDTHQICLPDNVGEIWVSGKSVAKGYWNNPDATNDTFGAQLSHIDGLAYLRTGDLGFLKDGELFVTGRLKDLIILGGNNHYPADIEHTVEMACEPFGKVASVAFSISRDAQEQLVILVEVDRKIEHLADELGKAITQAVSVRHELRAHDIRFVAAGNILKTSSGKIKRYLCKARYLEGNYQAIVQI